LYVGGEWVSPHGGGAIQIENPATETVVGSVPEGDPADVELAVRAARAAFREWSATGRRQRAEYLRRLHDALAGRSESMAKTIATEVGSPMRIASRIQTGLPLTVLAGYADLLEQDVADEMIGNSLVVREPVGVVGAITPWNYRCTRSCANWAQRWRLAAR
jgi:aldehyde dehydrogenase (NAD+)